MKCKVELDKNSRQNNINDFCSPQICLFDGYFLFPNRTTHNNRYLFQKELSKIYIFLKLGPIRGGHYKKSPKKYFVFSQS